MSQKTITLSCDQSGTTYTTELNLALEAMDSMHSGADAQRQILLMASFG